MNGFLNSYKVLRGSHGKGKESQKLIANNKKHIMIFHR